MNEEILDFSEKMERMFNVHKPEKGESYKTCDIEQLINKQREEYKEVYDLTNKIFLFKIPKSNITKSLNYLTLRNELYDLALTCMMLDYRLKLLMVDLKDKMEADLFDRMAFGLG